jgi:hypothetical protein
MASTLWKSPVASTAFVEGERFEQLGDSCTLTFEYEDENDEVVRGRLFFDGVQAFKCTYLYACSVEMIESYDKIVELGETDWLATVRGHLLIYNEALRNPEAKHSKNVIEQLDQYLLDTSDLKHLMIFFDGGPCYEFICKTFGFDETKMHAQS